MYLKPAQIIMAKNTQPKKKKSKSKNNFKILSRFTYLFLLKDFISRQAFPEKAAMVNSKKKKSDSLLTV